MIGEVKITISLALGEPQWYSLLFKGKNAGEIFIEGTYSPPKEDWNDNVSPMFQSTANLSPMNALEAETPIVAVKNPMGNLTNEAATAIMSIVSNSRKRGTLTQQGAIDIMKILKSPAAQARFLGTSSIVQTPSNQKALGEFSSAAANAMKSMMKAGSTADFQKPMEEP